MFCVGAVQDLVESVSVMNDSNNDWFLVAPDFTDYMRAQARPILHPVAATPDLSGTFYQPLIPNPTAIDGFMDC